MKTITIRRKKKLGNALMPYWIITGMTKDAFKQAFHLPGDLVRRDQAGMPISRLGSSLDDAVRILDALGTRIANGKTLVIEAEPTVQSVFAVSIDGVISNEIPIGNVEKYNLLLTPKGGWKTVSYPFLEEIEYDGNRKDSFEQSFDH